MSLNLLKAFQTLPLSLKVAISMMALASALTILVLVADCVSTWRKPNGKR